MSPRECANCARTSADGAPICTTCSGTLAEKLRGVRELLDDLLTSMAKQDRLDTGGGRSGRAEPPLPVRLDITPVIDALSGELTTWARDLVERHRWDVPDPPPSRPRNGRRGPVFPRADGQIDLAGYAAEFLAGRIAHLRQHPAAVEAHRALTTALGAAESACSAPPLRLFVGRCETCGKDLYGWPDHRAVRCGWCNTAYPDMRERWDLALNRLRGYPATAATIAGHVGKLYNVQVNQATIRKWHERGEITAVDWVPLVDGGRRTVPRYRIGAVLDRAARSKRHRAG